MQLYSVSFTTRAPVKKYDAKGKLVSETPNDKPVVMHALPYATAMSYSGADNFQMARYEPDQQRSPKGTGRDESVGNGTKRTNAVASVSAPVAAKALAKTKTDLNAALLNAASSGNLGAAING